MWAPLDFSSCVHLMLLKGENVHTHRDKKTLLHIIYSPPSSPGLPENPFHLADDDACAHPMRLRDELFFWGEIASWLGFPLYFFKNRDK